MRQALTHDFWELHKNINFAFPFLSFGRKGDTVRAGIILGDNPAGRCFLLSDLIPINFFQVSHDRETGNVRHRQKFC